MRHIARVLLGGLIALVLCTCASPRATGGLDATTIAALDAKIAATIDTHFDASVTPVLRKIPVHYVPGLSVPIIGKVDGYYNPATHAISVDPSIGDSCTAHEFAHAIWFQHLSVWRTLRFRIVMTTVAANPQHKAFTEHIQKGLARRHPVNDFFARATETYSDIFELLIAETPPVEVPDEIKSFYIGVLKERASADHTITMEEPPDAH